MFPHAGLLDGDKSPAKSGENSPHSKSLWLRRQPRQVGLGIRTPGTTEIRSGLDAGDTVVVGGQERLQDGMPVMVKPTEQPAAPAPGEGS